MVLLGEIESNVANPGSGAFFTPGCGISFLPNPRAQTQTLFLRS